jgi:hypothetical protein
MSDIDNEFKNGEWIIRATGVDSRIGKAEPCKDDTDQDK